MSKILTNGIKIYIIIEIKIYCYLHFCIYNCINTTHNISTIHLHIDTVLGLHFMRTYMYVHVYDGNHRSQCVWELSKVSRYCVSSGRVLANEAMSPNTIFGMEPSA